MDSSITTKGRPHRSRLCAIALWLTLLSSIHAALHGMGRLDISAEARVPSSVTISSLATNTYRMEIILPEKIISTCHWLSRRRIGSSRPFRCARDFFL